MGGSDAAGFFFDVFNDWPITRYQDKVDAIAIIIRIESNDRSRADHGICLTSGYWHLDLLLRSCPVIPPTPDPRSQLYTWNMFHKV